MVGETIGVLAMQNYANAMIGTEIGLLVKRYGPQLTLIAMIGKEIGPLVMQIDCLFWFRVYHKTTDTLYLLGAITW